MRLISKLELMLWASLCIANTYVGIKNFSQYYKTNPANAPKITEEVCEISKDENQKPWSGYLYIGLANITVAGLTGYRVYHLARKK